MKIKQVLSFLGPILIIMLLSFGCTESPSESEYYLFVGTYTSGESEGVYLYKFNSETGTATYTGEVAEVSNPSYLAISPDQKFLYSVSETGSDRTGSITAFSFNKETGRLNLLNSQPSGGNGPAYVAIDKTGKWVFAGNYASGSVGMLPVQEDGSLGAPVQTIQHQGSSINKSRQQRPHVHCTYISPDNEALFVTDLGTDEVTSYAFDAEKGTLSPEPISVFKAEPGAGPRHITFHPNGKFAYLVNELNGTVVAFRYREGALEPLQTISTLPDGYEGPVKAADIHVSPDGRFLYASNREDLNSIAIYAIDTKSGTLTDIGQEPSGGIHPRNFMIDPTGNYLLTANRNSDNIVAFERDESTGKLTPTGTEKERSMPVCLKMIPVN